MRKYSIYLLVFMIITSCEKIDQPTTVVRGFNFDVCPDVIPPEYEFPEFSNIDEPEQDVLLEDFTGHTCANCPGAALIAKQLEEEFLGRVHVASVHAGPGNGFQQVTAEYPTDFTTEAGNTYVEEIDPIIFGNPAGTINRLGGGPTGGIWFLPDGWAPKVDEAIASSPSFSIQLEVYYCSESNGLYVHSAIEKEANIQEGTYQYILYLLRQKVISPQTSGGNTIEDYEHHNVLSDNINGSWGTALAPDTLTIDEIVPINHSYQLPDPAEDETYAIENLAIIGFIVDRETDEVLQSQFLEL